MRLRDDIKEIKTSNKMFVSANKSRYIYKMGKNEDNKLLRANITKTCKKSNGKRLRGISFAAKIRAGKLSIVD